MTEAQHHEIIRQIAVVSTKVDGINLRLDTLNGSVARNTEDIRTLKSDRDKTLDRISQINATLAENKRQHEQLQNSREERTNRWIERIGIAAIVLFLIMLVQVFSKAELTSLLQKLL